MLLVVYLKWEFIVQKILCPQMYVLIQLFCQSLWQASTWINASSAKDVAERLRHLHSAFVESPTSTSACVLVRDSMPVALP